MRENLNQYPFNNNFKEIMYILLPKIKYLLPIIF